MKIDTNNGEDADDKAGTETAVGAKEVVYIYVCVVHFTVNVSLLFSTYFFNLFVILCQDVELPLVCCQNRVLFLLTPYN